MNAPQPTEFVYTWYEPEASYEDGCWHAHRILKKTKEFVYVQWRVCGYLSKHPYTETRKLRRRELEEKGRAWWNGRSHTGGEAFYSELGKSALDLSIASRSFVPECLKAFGLTQGATIDDLNHAYHEQALKEHPDTGGSHEGFLKLQEQYQAALRMVKS